MIHFARRNNRNQTAQKFFLGFFILNLVTFPAFQGIADEAVSPQEGSDGRNAFIEELSQEGKKDLIQNLLKEGDEYFLEKKYDQANEAYEEVFLVEPGGLEASRKIDRLKKQLIQEGKKETEVVSSVYNEEIRTKVKLYWAQVNQFMEQGKIAQARFAVQKILMLNPFDEKAIRLYQDLQAKLAGE